MAKGKMLIIVSVIATLLVVAAVIVVLSAGRGGEGRYRTPSAAVESVVLEDGATVRITLLAISVNDVDFRDCKMLIHMPSGQSNTIDLNNMAWIRNDSAPYTIADGYTVTINRTGAHDYFCPGDRIEISGLGLKLATGIWSLVLVDSHSEGPIASVSQVVE